MTDQELIALLEGGATSTANPEQAIRSVADKHGIDPAYLLGLAKLETQVGKKAVGETKNLFNIKDFAGNGVSAYDKVEKSRDKYRQYQSYEQSAEDLVALLKKRYPGALTASTPDEFGQSLKGYATDPKHAQKVASIARSYGADSGATTISDADLIKILESGTPQSAAQPTAEVPTSDTFGGKAKTALSSALHSVSAGLIPEFATKKEQQQYPVSRAIGGLVGTVPYALVPGGMVAKSALLGARGAAQTAAEGGSTGEQLLSGAIEGAAPGIGVLAGKAISLGGRVLGGAYSAITPGTQAVRSAIEKGLSKKELAALYAKTRYPTIAPTTGTLSQAAQQTASNVTKQIENAVIPTQSTGGVVNMVTGIPGAIKAGVAKGIVESVPQFPSLMKYVVRNLPKDAVRKEDYMWIVGEGAFAQGLTEAQTKAAIKAAAKLYDQIAERHLAQAATATAVGTGALLSGRPVVEHYQNK